ncbi:MAG: hypothetical protein JOY59_08295 [Candidatus Eremiobacteraeota bacterium]|nr:hypothetical protein [Candidatus Eremiobacteraeota bacterium]
MVRAARRGGGANPQRGARHLTARFAGGLVLIPLAFAAGALASHLVLPFLTANVGARALAQPILVATSWGSAGAFAWAILAATLLFAGLGYAAVLRELGRAEASRVAFRAAFIATIAATAAACTFRFVFSSDLYAYAAYGALVATHQDPYQIHLMDRTVLTGPAFTEAIRFEWPSLPACVYGPIALLLARGLISAFHGNLSAILIAYRVLVVVAFFVGLMCVSAAAPGRRLTFLAVIGLNPLAIWSVCEGHNDFLVFALAAFGALLAGSRPARGGAIIALSSLVKAIAVPVALVFAAAVGAGGRRLWMGTLAGLLVAALVQIWTFLAAGGLQVMVATDFVGTRQAGIAQGLNGVLALVVVWVGLVHWGAGARLRGLSAFALALWVLLPHHYAWYGFWLTPLAAVTLQTSEGKALLVATFCGALRYLPDATGAAGAAPWTSLLAAFVPAASLLTPLSRAKKPASLRENPLTT